MPSANKPSHNVNNLGILNSRPYSKRIQRLQREKRCFEFATWAVETCLPPFVSFEINTLSKNGLTTLRFCEERKDGVLHNLKNLLIQ